jgi:hypothetical protein
MEPVPTPNPGHATAPTVLVAVIVTGMVVLSLGTVAGSFELFLAGLLIFCGSFGLLIAITPEPVRAPPTVDPASSLSSSTSAGTPSGARRATMSPRTAASITGARP